MEENSTDTQVIDHALNAHHSVPNVSALWPANSHWSIAWMIGRASVQRA